MLENILLSRGAGRMAEQLRDITEPSRFADLSGYSPDLTLAQKVEVLETLDLEARLRLVLGWARDTLADLTLREQIKTDVEEGMEKTQREFLLRRQLEAIRKELGRARAATSADDDPDDYRAKLDERDLPEHVRTAVQREVDKLERTSEQSPETGGSARGSTRSSRCPGASSPRTASTSSRPAGILDEDHDGLKDVKERILEHLAVRKLQADRGSPRGRPRLGRDPRARRAAGRGQDLARRVGGPRPRPQVRPRRRWAACATRPRSGDTAAPTSAHSRAAWCARCREAGTMNPVIVLDEVDKLGADYRGDPSSALLEVLDPAQNHTFRDHYLEVELDLSKVLFLATANVAETIPGPLLDRMEVIRLDGYTEDEKVTIARHHLFRRQLARAALRADEVEVSDEALRTISADYTREAGVRNLEREIGRLLRKVATKLASGERQAPGVVDAPDVRGWLGRPALLLRGRRSHQRARRGDGARGHRDRVATCCTSRRP